MTAKIPGDKQRTAIQRVFNRIMILVVIVFLFSIWTAGEGSLATMLGFISAGIAVSLREEIVSFVGWLKITTGALFREGDIIEVNSIKGRVLSIDFFYVTLKEKSGASLGREQSTGRIVYMANSIIMAHPIFNSSATPGFIWNNLSIVLAKQEDLEKVKQLLNDVIKKGTKTHLKEEKDPILTSKLTTKGIEITARYSSTAETSQQLETSISESLLKKLQQAHIKLVE